MDRKKLKNKQKIISSHRPRYIIGLNQVDETALVNGNFKKRFGDGGKQMLYQVNDINQGEYNPKEDAYYVAARQGIGYPLVTPVMQRNLFLNPLTGARDTVIYNGADNTYYPAGHHFGTRSPRFDALNKAFEIMRKKAVEEKDLPFLERLKLVPQHLLNMLWTNMGEVPKDPNNAFPFQDKTTQSKAREAFLRVPKDKKKYK